jgi:hypothetical protein
VGLEKGWGGWSFWCLEGEEREVVVVIFSSDFRGERFKDSDSVEELPSATRSILVEARLLPVILLYYTKGLFFFFFSFSVDN